MRVDGDDGNRAVVGDHGGCDQHRAVDERSGQTAQVALFPADAVVPPETAGVGHQLVAGFLDRLGDSLQELGGERLELSDEDADDVRATATEAPRHDGRLVAELLDDLLDPELGLRRDTVPAVDHLRYSRDRDARGSRDVTDGHPSRGLHEDDSSAPETRRHNGGTSC